MGTQKRPGRSPKDLPGLHSFCVERAPPLRSDDTPLDHRNHRRMSAHVVYGITTGQAVAPLVVQTMRSWMAGLTGVLVVM